MSIEKSLPDDKKLHVICRLEAGCLGPDGENHINDFCTFVQKKIEAIDVNIILWEVLSRKDKTLPEMEYKINNKKLSHDQARKYLEMFDRSIDDFEELYYEKIFSLIDEYFKK